MDTLVSAPEAVKRPRRTTRALYRPLNAEVWPSRTPPLTDAEAVKAARLLYRRFYVNRWQEEYRDRPKWQRLGPRKKMPVRVNRKISHARFGDGALLVNPEQGWRAMVHSLSHRFHSYLRPHDKSHSDNHRHLEKDMIAYVVSSGWLDGKLKPKPRPVRAAKPKPDPVVVEHERVLARIKTWQSKAKRAENALKKLRKQAARLARKRERTITFTL